MLKTTRDLLAERLAHVPFGTAVSASDFAREFGVSRERIRQLLHSLGYRAERQPRFKRGTYTNNVPEGQVLIGGTPVQRTETLIGTASELVVGADLIHKHWNVFFPLTRTGACDLVILRYDHPPLRIEVRTGRRRSGSISYATPDMAQCDHLAIVVAGEPILYKPPLPD